MVFAAVPGVEVVECCKTTNYGNYCGGQRWNIDTTTNRIHGERLIRTNAVQAGRRGASMATQQSTKVEIMFFFIVLIVRIIYYHNT